MESSVPNWIEDQFCQGEPILDYNQLWNTTVPRFTRCFQRTLPVWLPAGLFWLVAPYQVYSLLRKLDSFRRNRISIPFNRYNVTRLLTAVMIVLVCLIQLGYDAVRYFGGRFSDQTLVADVTGSLVNVCTFAFFAFLLNLHRISGVHTSAFAWNFTFLSLIFVLPTAYMYSMLVWNPAAFNSVQEFNVFEFVIFVIHFVMLFLLFGLTCFADHKLSIELVMREEVVDVDQDEQSLLWSRRRSLSQDDDQVAALKESPELSASFVSKFTYWWFNSLALTGYRKTLTAGDLWQLLPEDKTEFVGTRFSHGWDSQKNRSRANTSEGTTSKSPGTLSTLLRTFGCFYLYACVFQLANLLLSFVNPQLLKLFIDFISKPEEPIWHGFFIAFLLFAVSSLQSLLFVHFLRIMLIIGNRVRNSLISAIYRKSLVLSSAARRNASSGQIVNLMSVDAQHFVDLLPDTDLAWGAPLQISLTMYFLWLELGPSVLAGIAVMFLFMPLNWWLTRYQTRFYTAQMETKDERVKVINEMLNGIRVIKLYGWEVSFIDKVATIRNRETGYLKKIAYINAVTSIFWITTPFWVSFVSFAVYVLSSNEHILDAKKAFVSLALFELLRYPLAAIPEMINQTVVTLVSIRRLNRFLNAAELGDYVKREQSNFDEDIVVENGTFRWGEAEAAVDPDDDDDDDAKEGEDKKEESPTAGTSETSSPTSLNSINLRIKKGSLTAIVGQVGTGKSSLLSAILGDMELQSGSVNISQSASIAYVAQQAWIRNATLRDNILFGSEYQESRYESILRMCALKPDIAMLPAGDQTEIGEKGINLSGGQKQRVAIARACYANCDIVLMDDPLSAVDSHVAKHIFNHVISNSTGYLQGRTRVLTTNNIAILPEVDQIVVLTNGTISEIGTYEELIENEGKFADFVKEHGTDAAKVQESDDTIVIERPETPKTPKLTKDLQSQQDRLIEEEHAEEGRVKWSVYVNYLRSLTYLWLGLMAVGFVGMQSAEVGSEIWLAIWSNDQSSPNATTNQENVALRNERLLVYGLFGLANGILFFFACIALAKGSVRSSISLHRRLLDRVMRSPMQFFDTTPLGRIVNRFSKDMDVVDGTIPFTIEGWLICLLHVVSVFVLIVLQVPIFTLVVLPILALYYFIQKFYIATYRQLSRLESVTLSPIYSHFGETLSGVNTIRAFGRNCRFVVESNNFVDANQRTFYPSIMANRWLAVRLEFCGNLIVLFAAVFSVLSRNAFHDKPGFIGLIITYALGITETLNWLVRNTSEIESSIVSVERIGEYSEIIQEHEWTREVNQNPVLPQDWPEKGEIDFVDYSVRYRDGLDPVLKKVNIEIRSGEKIGIVGRTGAGKSSLTLALFRILESAGGKIVIDGVDISQIGLHELRSKLSIIPQDPILFSGTVRSNLDPFNCYTDDQIWQALEHSHLKDYIATLDSGLEHQISENGENLSVGQRQLICLGRALLRKTKILVLDEATAAIDLETDSLIQNTIRNEFTNCTILTIAHRLHTIMDSSRVLVLHQGTVAEFDTPDSLLSDTNSRFYSLAKDARII